MLYQLSFQANWEPLVLSSFCVIVSTRPPATQPNHDIQILGCFHNQFTAPFNMMRTLKFKAQLTNAFFATVNQMFCGSSQLPTTAEQCFVVWTVHNDLITGCSAVVGSWEKLPNIWLTVAKNAFVGWALSFRVRILLKGTEMKLIYCRIWWDSKVRNKFTFLFDVVLGVAVAATITPYMYLLGSFLAVRKTLTYHWAQGKLLKLKKLILTIIKNWIIG